MTTAPIRIIARADDAGLTVGTNEAILDTCRKGIIRAVGLMMPTPNFQHAADLFRNEPGLCLGLHGCITSEWSNVHWGPVLPRDQVPSLVDENGYFLSDSVAIHKRGFSAREIGLELRAQLALAQKAGLKLRYLDTHMGFDWLAGVKEEILALCQENNLIYTGSLNLAKMPELPKFENPLDRLTAYLEAATPGDHMLVTHPCKDDPISLKLMRFPGKPEEEPARQRNEEALALQNPKLRQIIQSRNIEIIHHTDVALR